MEELPAGKFHHVTSPEIRCTRARSAADAGAAKTGQFDIQRTRPPTGLALPLKTETSGCSRGAARQLGYINHAEGRKGHDRYWHDTDQLERPPNVRCRGQSGHAPTQVGPQTCGAPGGTNAKFCFDRKDTCVKKCEEPI